MRYCKICGCEVGKFAHYCESCRIERDNELNRQSYHRKCNKDPLFRSKENERRKGKYKESQALWRATHPEEVSAIRRKASAKYREKKKYELWEAIRANASNLCGMSAEAKS